MSDPNRHGSIAQLCGTPSRTFYTGPDLARATAIDDLRARAHRTTPRIALEYLEGGAEDEASLARDREQFADWRFRPKALVDVSRRSARCDILGRAAPSPVIVAPTGLNAAFRRGADLLLAQGAAAASAPFVQSTMSNERMEEVAKTEGLRHWFQLYVFGGDEVWRELVRRADACGCEALVVTVNAQIYGHREWDERTRATRTRPSIATILDMARHPVWIARTLSHGLPTFANVAEFVPKGRRDFFGTAFWIRDRMRQDLSWDLIAEIRRRWPRAFVLKGLLRAEDVRRAKEIGADAAVLSTHGGRQLDWSIGALDALPAAREAAGGDVAIHISGGIRRGTDIVKAVALGADAMMAGRAILYGLCAGGAAGVARALEILRKETGDAMGLVGVNSLNELTPDLLTAAGPVAEAPATRRQPVRPHRRLWNASF